jgi:chloride channel protein, CIC family
VGLKVERGSGGVGLARHLDWATRPFGLFFDPDLRRRGRWIVYAILIGTVSGVGAILFDLVFRIAQRLLIVGVGRFQPPSSGLEGGPGFGPEAPWRLVVSLVIGGALSGALVFGLAPEAEGHGTDAVLRAFHRLRGKIRRRVPAVKAIASAITIGSGGSAGREGPIAQIGAGFGSFLSDVAGLRNADRRVMMMAGAAGGIGSIFRAPLGAALFAAEVLYSEPEFEYQVLLPGLISAITGYCIYSLYAGWGYLFAVPPISFHQPNQLPLYALLGVACALVGMLYIRVFYGMRDHVFRPLRIPAWTKPALGALTLGGVAVFFPEALGMGYGYIQEAIQGQHPLSFLLVFAAVKILATSLTISSGGSGGVFGPSLVIGGALGAAFGQATAWFVPSLAPSPAACVMVGMGGFFAGVAKVPFASVIMVMEMTGSYGLLVPSLLVAAIAYLVLPPRTSLYENQVPARIDSPAHLGSFATDILRLARVQDGWEPEGPPFRTVAEDAPLSSLVDLVSETRQDLLPVVDPSGTLAGELSVEDLRRALVAEAALQEIRARDLMQPAADALVPEDDLDTAARLLADRPARAVTVVGDRGTRRVIGVFTQRDLIVAYGRRLARLRGVPNGPRATP